MELRLGSETGGDHVVVIESENGNSLSEAEAGYKAGRWKHRVAGGERR